MPPSVIVGSLLLQLQDADDRLAEVEQRVANLIGELLPGWSGGWEWVRPAGIEVYSAEHSSERQRTGAALTLRIVGFVDVKIHDHSKGQRLITCSCPWRTPP